MTVSEGDKMDRLPHEKGFHVSWDQLHRDSRALAWRLDGQGPAGAPWRAVVAITRGGMAPAMIVARELDIRMVDTISVKSYDHQSQSEPRVIKCPSRDLVCDGTGVLVRAKRSNWLKPTCRMRISPQYMLSPWGARWSILSSQKSARTHGFSFHGTWLCNMLSLIVARTELQKR